MFSNVFLILQRKGDWHDMINESEGRGYIVV
jgi:hypothetical protein